MKTDLATHSYANYFNYYIDLVEDKKLSILLETNNNKIKDLFDLLVESQGSFSYAKGKWTIKELLVHLIDAERIFCYRALNIARNESTDLPGFDHDDCVKYSNANNRSLFDIAKEFDSVRNATISLFNSFTPEMLNKSGKANGKEMTVLAIGYFTIGHVIHHINILNEKYLNNE